MIFPLLSLFKVPFFPNTFFSVKEGFKFFFINNIFQAPFFCLQHIIATPPNENPPTAKSLIRKPNVFCANILQLVDFEKKLFAVDGFSR